MMTAFLDLFSGIGGFALSAYQAGLRFDKHYFSEVNPYAVELYQKRFPEAEPLGDIRNVDYSKLPKGDWLVTDGFPCQPHSVAGKQKGSADERDLWPECARMLRELRPAVALFENVTGLLTSPGRKRKGEFFNGVLSDISESGYNAEWQVISALDAGAPHLRKRVWIVAHAESKRCGNGHDCQNESQADREIHALANSSLPIVEKSFSDSLCKQLQERMQTRNRRPESTDGNWWAVEPDVGRVAHGIPAQVDRLKCLGNAVVPQCAEMIFQLLAFDFWREA